MNRILFHAFYTVALTSLAVWSGCGTDSGAPLTPVGDDANSKRTFEVANAGRGIEVVPMFNRPTGRRGERLTVYIFNQHRPDNERPEGRGGGRGGGGGGEEPTCPDPNTNEAFNIVDRPSWAASGIDIEYHPAEEPESVLYDAFTAVAAGFSAWETAVDDPDLVNFSEAANPDEWLPPDRDFNNVVGWGHFTGRGARNVLAAAWIWDDGQSNIIEVDIFFNSRQDWIVNESIQPGDNTCGTDYDVQAIATHEIGHLIGLGHVTDDGNTNNGDETDATMAPTAAKKELQKQTLTTGDEDGAAAVVPEPV